MVIQSCFSITVVFIARDKNNEDISALKTITVLKGKNINEKLDKSGMIVVDLRGNLDYLLSFDEVFKFLYRRTETFFLFIKILTVFLLFSPNYADNCETR